MRRIFTFSFLAVALTLASFSSFAQCIVTTGSNTSCSGANATITDFNSSNGSFTTSGSMSYSAADGDIRNTSFSNGTFSATITSGLYNKGPFFPNNVQAGFVLNAGNKNSVTSVTLNILDASNAVIATCTTNNPANGQLCFSVTDPDLTPGVRFRYQFVINYTASGNPNASNGGLVTFDNFGYANGANAPLPVKFSAFEAKTASNGVALNWTVGSEINVSGYTIEKSTDGRSFTKIGFVSADGKSSYSFVDAQGAGAVAYYRIKSVDNDGKYNFSTVAVLRGGKYAIVLKAFPSPFVNKLTVQHGTANAGSLIAISSEDGRTIRSVVPVIGTQQTEIDLTTAKAGLYLVRYSNSNGQVETLKVLKQ